MKRPKRDEKWHAMMKRRREIMHPVKKNHECIQSSHGVQWVRGHMLGKGSFGSVFFATTKIAPPISDDDYLPSVMAVKSAELSLASSLRDEKKILCDLRASSYVIDCYGVELTKPDDCEKVHYNILLEYCSGGSLAQRIYKSGTGLPEFEVRRYTRDIVRGLYYIHNRGYVHCDIKPSNILLAPSKNGDYTAKIADFGLAKRQSFDEDEIDCFSLRGTYPYMSPEVVREKIQEWPADVWALGCVVIEMMSGKPVWGYEVNSNVDDLLGRIAYSPELPEIPSSMSEEGKDFLDKCLVRDAGDRWHAEMLSQHPFVSGNFWEADAKEKNKLYS